MWHSSYKISCSWFWDSSSVTQNPSKMLREGWYWSCPNKALFLVWEIRWKLCDWKLSCWQDWLRRASFCVQCTALFFPSHTSSRLSLLLFLSLFWVFGTVMPRLIHSLFFYILNSFCFHVDFDIYSCVLYIQRSFSLVLKFIRQFKSWSFCHRQAFLVQWGALFTQEQCTIWPSPKEVSWSGWLGRPTWSYSFWSI